MTRRCILSYHTAYKTPLYRIVYEKSDLLLAEIEHRVYWAVKIINLDQNSASPLRKLQLNELDESRHADYENTCIFKEKMKTRHD